MSTTNCTSTPCSQHASRKYGPAHPRDVDDVDERNPHDVDERTARARTAGARNASMGNASAHNAIMHNASTKHRPAYPRLV